MKYERLRVAHAQATFNGQIHHRPRPFAVAAATSMQIHFVKAARPPHTPDPPAERSECRNSWASVTKVSGQLTRAFRRRPPVVHRRDHRPAGGAAILQPHSLGFNGSAFQHDGNTH